MKNDLLLEQFRKMTLDSNLTFQVKGGDVASQCFLKRDSLSTTMTTDYTNAPATSDEDKTFLGTMRDIFIPW